MTQTQFIILVVLLSVLLIISLVAVILISKKKNNKEYDQLLQKMQETGDRTAAYLAQSEQKRTEETRNSRMELTQTLSTQRQEMTIAMQDMSKRLEKMTHDNYAFNMQTTQTIERHMTELRKGNEEKLEKMRQTVDEKLNETLTQRLDSSFKTVSEQLENVYKSLGEMKVLSTGVTENVTSLNRILTNVKARGTWAEVQLEGLLDQTIPGMFVKNFQLYLPAAGFQVPGGGLHPPVFGCRQRRPGRRGRGTQGVGGAGAFSGKRSQKVHP